MKKLLTIVFGLLATLAGAQIHNETISKELTFEKKAPNNALMLMNVNGDVTVTGYTGDKIIVEVEKVIRAKTEARLASGKEEIQLGMIDRADTIILYVQGVCSEFGKLKRKENWQSKWNGYGYNWNNCNGRNCDKAYDYEMNFKVKVPAGVSVYASTVNDGDVIIENTTGYVLADNVNGSIRLTNISGATNASTINGDVDLDYTKNPVADCRYYSLNGDINALFIKGLSAQVAFDSFNGDFYTNVDQLENLPVAMEKKETGKGIKFKVSGNRYKVGGGTGPLLDFETFNGNAYLKEKK